MSLRVIVAKSLVFDKLGRVLVLRRSVWPMRPKRSHQPDLPGGSVDKGETERHAAIRELQEETGIIATETDLNIIHSETFLHGKQVITKFLYTLQLDYTPEVKLSWEHESYEWTDVSNLPNYEFSPPNKRAILFLFDNKLL